MLTAPFVLALALLPAGKPAAMPPKAARALSTVHGFKFLKEIYIPPPVTPMNTGKPPIEVTVGKLPSHVGGRRMRPSSRPPACPSPTRPCSTSSANAPRPPPPPRRSRPSSPSSAPTTPPRPTAPNSN